MSEEERYKKIEREIKQMHEKDYLTRIKRKLEEIPHVKCEIEYEQDLKKIRMLGEYANFTIANDLNNHQIGLMYSIYEKDGEKFEHGFFQIQGNYNHFLCMEEWDTINFDEETIDGLIDYLKEVITRHSEYRFIIENTIFEEGTLPLNVETKRDALLAIKFYLGIEAGEPDLSLDEYQSKLWNRPEKFRYDTAASYQNAYSEQIHKYWEQIKFVKFLGDELVVDRAEYPGAISNYRNFKGDFFKSFIKAKSEEIEW